MGEFTVVGDELKKMVKLGKKRPMPFAYAPKDDEGCLFATDRKKTPEVIARATKKESGQAKIAFGTFVVEGKLMILTLTKELPGIAKKLKKHFRGEKLNINIKVVDISGNELESDIEDLPDDPDMDAEDEGAEVELEEAASPEELAADAAILAEPDPDEPPINAGELAQRLKAVQPWVMAAKGEPGDRLRTVMMGAIQLIRDKDMARAEPTVTALERAVERLRNSSDRPNVSPEDLAAANPAAQTEADRETLALAQKIQSLRGKIEALPEGAARDRLMQALGVAVQLLRANDMPKCAQAVAAVEKALGQVQAASKAAETEAEEDEGEGGVDMSSPEAQKWLAVAERLEPAVLGALKAGKGDVNAIRLKWMTAQDKAEKGDFAAALAIAPDLAKLIRDAASATQTQAEGEIPKDIVPYVQSRLAWIKTREGLRSELARLKSAIDSALKAADLGDAVSETDKLFDYLDALDSRLENKLEEITVAPAGPARDKLKAEARTIIAEYRTNLDSEFFKDVDGNNGFVPVSVRGAAISSLSSVASALS